VTLQKTWVNGIPGDQVGLGIDYDIIHAAGAVSTSNGFAGAWTDTSNTAVLAVPAGKTVVVAEAFVPGHHDGRYTASLSCPGVKPIFGFFKMPATNVVCTWTNDRRVPMHTVTFTKTWVNGVDGDGADLVAESSDGNLSGHATSTSHGEAGSWTDTASPATLDMPMGYEVNLWESPAGPLNGTYLAPVVTCDNVTPDGGVFTMPDSDVTCTVTNTATQSSVTLQKEWVAGVSGDTAELSINGGDAVTSTSNGDRGAVTDTTHVATAMVSQGSLVNVAEVLGEGNAGTYTSAVTCAVDGSMVPVEDGQFRMPYGDVTCTYENRASQHTLRLQKEWVNGVEGDQATITIDNAGFIAPTTSTSNGQQGSWVDSDHAVQIPASAGSPVNVSEAFGEDSGYYNSSLVCDGVEPDASGNFVMPDAAVTCTLTNQAMGTMTLEKKWVNGVKGDTATMTIIAPDQEIAGKATSTSNGQTGAWTDTTNVAWAPIPVGMALDLTEALGASNKGAYTSTLTCNGEAVTATYTMPQGDVTCTFTNTVVVPVTPVVPVKPAAATGLPNTGSDIGGALGVGGILAALGGLLALAAAWRRRRMGHAD
jgi:hypothetical protein